MDEAEYPSLNLIPMAGLGLRFSDAGYTVPKPLIDVGDGVPMIAHAASCLPPASQWSFICRQEHVDTGGVDEVLRSTFPDCNVMPIDFNTEGQVSSCLIAREHIAVAGWLNIGACDNYMVYDQQRFTDLQTNPSVDAIIWTFRHNPVVSANPEMYGWVKVDGSRVEAVSVKVPISDDPLTDHAIIGAFSFRRGKDFLLCADRLIENDRRINGEFYIDELMNVAVEAGLHVEVLEVDQYIGWGTPADFETFKFWQSFFSQNRI